MGTASCLHWIIMCMATWAQGFVAKEPLYGISTGVSYTMAVTVGGAGSSKPPSTYQLLLDTGSSNMAVATTTCCSNSHALGSLAVFSCAASPTCASTTQPATNISVKYIASSWTGHVVKDMVATPQLGAVPDFQFVAIDAQQEFFKGGYNGILGVAFDSLAQPRDKPMSTLVQTLVDRQQMDNVFGVLLCGILQPFVRELRPSNVSGAIVFGGVAAPTGPALHRGPIVYTPLVQAKWYVVLVTDVAYNGSSLRVPCTSFNAPKAIVDSGTTNIVLPPPVYRPLMAMLRDATLQAIPDFPSTYFSDRSVCCEAYCDPTNVNSTLMALPSLSFSFALQGNVNEQVTITIPPTYYWRPIAVQSAVGTTTCRMIGLSEGTSLILGNVFMDGLYTVHDRRRGQVGFAIADNCDNLAISTKTISTSAMPSATTSWCDCLSTAQLNDNLVTSKLPGQRACFIWYWWTYVFLVSIIVIAICCAILLWMWIAKRRRNNTQRRTAGPPPSFLQHQLLDDEGPMTPKEAPPISPCSESRSPSVVELPAASTMPHRTEYAL